MKSFHQPRDLFREFVSWLSQEGKSPANLMKLNNLMKKLLFLGAFAFFALTVSAQSTEAPADNKAKTEQTCSKDAKKASCSKDKQQDAAASPVLQPTPKGRPAARTSLLDAAASRVLLPTPRARRAARTSLPVAAPRARPQHQPKARKESPRRSAATRPLACPRASDSCNTELRKGCPWGGPFFVHGVAGEASRTQLCTIRAGKRSVPWMWVP